MQKQKSAVVAFGFGEPSSAHPNARIAKTAINLARNTRAVSVFTDRDVSPHLSGCEVAPEVIDQKRVPTTYRLAVLAAEGAKKHGVSTLDVVAARCHMRRCLRDLQWAMQDCGVTVKLKPHTILGYQYDPSAATFFTRSAWRWWPFEIAYRIASTLFPEWYKRTRA